MTIQGYQTADMRLIAMCLIVNPGLDGLVAYMKQPD